MEAEIWKDITGYEGLYQVSTLGRVLSLRKNIILKPGNDKDGYLNINLSLNSKSKTLKIHRIVAKMFIENIDNKPQVNHIDFNKKNNNINNLEWCTIKENSMHNRIFGVMPIGEKHYAFGKFRGLSKSAKIVLDLETGIFYDCAKDAADAKNIKYSTLKGKLNGNDNNNTDLIYC